MSERQNKLDSHSLTENIKNFPFIWVVKRIAVAICALASAHVLLHSIAGGRVLDAKPKTPLSH